MRKTYSKNEALIITGQYLYEQAQIMQKVLTEKV